MVSTRSSAKKEPEKKDSPSKGKEPSKNDEKEVAMQVDETPTTPSAQKAAAGKKKPNDKDGPVEEELVGFVHVGYNDQLNSPRKICNWRANWKCWLSASKLIDLFPAWNHFMF